MCSTILRPLALPLNVFSVLMATPCHAQDENLAKGASSHQADYQAGKVIDQVVSDSSRWLAKKGDEPPSAEITFSL